MMKRIAALLLLLGIACGVAAAPAAAFDPFGVARIDGKPGAAVPLDGPFRDSRGRAVTLRQLAGGKPMLLAPILHNCPNICGVTLSGLARAIAGQSHRAGRDFVVVAFGIDPKEGPRDAAGDLDRLLAQAPTLDRSALFGLTGDRRDVRAVTDALGYHYAFDKRIGQYAHSAAVAVVDPEGRLSGWLYGLTPDPAELSAAIDAAADGKAAQQGEPLLLLCFHYDPVTGRYTPAIEKIIRLAAIATLAGLALVFRHLRRRRA